MRDPSSLLLVTHVALRQGPNGLQIDDQTAAGIAQWCRHFGKVTYYGVSEPEGQNAGGTTTWVDIKSMPALNEASVFALPRAYSVKLMLREQRQVTSILKSAIDEHEHLCYTIGGLVGDWPALAAFESIKRKRNYAAWIDRVEPSVIRNKLKSAPFRKRAAAAAAIPVMESYTRYLLRNSTVALLQGRDTFDHYAASARDPHCTYDTHTQIFDQITPDALRRKQDRILSGEPLHIIYTGRADPMKGARDWLETLERLNAEQVPFKATWIGDGPELQAMKARVKSSGLADFIEFAGFEADREKLFQGLRDSDLLLFCHKTPESARCLIEALVAGCPIVGYETAYPADLVQNQGGGCLSPRDNIGALVKTVADLHMDRPSLAKLVASAAASGTAFNEDAVYAHRATLMLRG